MSERPYCGPDGGQIVEQVAAGLIADLLLHQRWTDFDHWFLSQCVQESDEGIVFNREGFATFPNADEALLLLGVKVYNAASQEAVRQSSTSYRILNVLAVIYYAAYRACK